MAHVCHGFLAGSKGSADAKQQSRTIPISKSHHTFKHIEIYIYIYMSVYVYIYIHTHLKE